MKKKTHIPREAMFMIEKEREANHNRKRGIFLLVLGLVAWFVVSLTLLYPVAGENGVCGTYGFSCEKGFPIDRGRTAGISDTTLLWTCQGTNSTSSSVNCSVSDFGFPGFSTPICPLAVENKNWTSSPCLNGEVKPGSYSTETNEENILFAKFTCQTLNSTIRTRM